MSAVLKVLVFFVFLFIPFSIQAQNTIQVPVGGNLQAAINAAQPGDTIILQANADYKCSCILPNKTGTSYITIRSSRYGEIGDRVGREPSLTERQKMARVESIYSTEATFRTAPGAHHYKLQGLEIKPRRLNDQGALSPAYTIFELGTTGTDQDSPEEIPQFFEVDKVWIHGDVDQEVQRGVGLNSGNTNITNSWITDIHGYGYDTQAIGGWNGPGPFNIINNYLEASGENVMFGGALSTVAGVIPSDIVFRGNEVIKPLSWNPNDPSYAGRRWTVKNLFELKNARNVLVEDSVFENSWPDAQVGYALVFTVRGEVGDKNKWNTVQNVSVRNSVVRNAESGVQTLGLDDLAASVQGRGLYLYNIRFERLKHWGILVQSFPDMRIEHVTLDAPHSTLVFTGQKSNNFVYVNSASTPSDYGFKADGGGSGTSALNQYSDNWIVQGNVIAGAPASSYPVNNFYPSDLTNLDSFKGTDGLVPGAVGGSSQPIPTPVPTPVPSPSPSPSPVPTPEGESPNNTRVPPGSAIKDSNGTVWTLASDGKVLQNGSSSSGGSGSQILYCARTVYVLGDNREWWQWAGDWRLVGPVDPCGSPTPTPTPTPTPMPMPSPAPTPSACVMFAPSSVIIPRRGNRSVTVTLNNLNGFTEISAVPTSGQVSVTPGLRKVSGASVLAEFMVAVKQNSASIKFTSSCGTQTTNVVVR